MPDGPGTGRPVVSDDGVAAVDGVGAVGGSDAVDGSVDAFRGLDETANAALVRLARGTLEAATGGRRSHGTDATAIPPLRLGAFVTLTIGGELRGCMGRLDFDRWLADNVVAAAWSVASDPRFPPLRGEELPLVRVEVSAITAPVPIRSADAFDVRRHGIVVERGWRRALLLPQVARERGWDARRTLRAVCEKAGMGPDDWRLQDVRLSVFVSHEALEAVSEEPAPALIASIRP
ncbi:MAG TPA: AmmeMemoRadiSam system protein A [Candidatus Dormibacteraeota bacterium]|nr:AmmeMemoRadiSam system protein A [Candidatus Dormibacteraeota bacterium]